MEETLQKVYDLLMLYGVKVIAAIAIFIIGRWVAKGFRSITKKLMDKRNVDPTITGFVGNLTYMALLVFVIIAALGQLESKQHPLSPSWVPPVLLSVWHYRAVCPILPLAS